MGKTLYQKIWERHLVREAPGGMSVLYVDRHLVHEVTSPQAFEGLRRQQRKIRRPEKIIATLDHSIPTRNRHLPIGDPIAAKQVETLRRNCRENGLRLLDLDHPGQGIIHVIAPEQGMVLPGLVVVCGDSHTATHGAFGALAFGIGTSEVEHVFATQTLHQYPSKTLRVLFTGNLSPGVTAKDMTLFVIGRIGTAGGTGYVIEYGGEAVEKLSLEGRMTLCNMAIECGARAGMVAPDEKAFGFLKDKPGTPRGARWDAALADWRRLKTDADAVFDRELVIQADTIVPQVTWGTSPGQVTGIDESVPAPESFTNVEAREACRKALAYMDLKPGTPLTAIAVDHVFIGSCTNSRLEDLRAAAQVLRGHRIHPTVSGIVVPGSGIIKREAEAEGLHRVFLDAGLEWREPGCSMCLGMNDDILQSGQRCASTSNRNFEGRQGKGSRTHLLSPAMAAAAASHGHLVDVRRLI